MIDKGTVLVVDDNPINLNVLVDFLDENGFETCVADSGQSALNLLDYLDPDFPDIILLDVVMPDISGFETCRRLKTKAELKDIPVIFMTALSDAADKVKGFAAGAVDYVTKPIEHEDVLARLTTHLTISNLQKELSIEVQQQTAELRYQSEELLLANEELEAQTENLKATARELQDKQIELERTNLQLKEKATALEASSLALREKQNALDQHNQELEVAQSELETKARELAQASQFKSEFLANMSHELRTPLNSLLILARILADNKEGNLTPEQIESAQIIHNGGQDLLELINDILDLSKVEAGKLTFHIEAVSLQDLMISLRSQFAHVALENGLEFWLTLAADLPSYIKTDQQRLTQIIKNLLSNAFKFTATGQVNFKISRPDTDADLSISGLDPQQAIALSVMDSGIGMTPDQQEIIFNAFQQADGSTNRQYGGTGLGLSISKKLATKLGGQISLKSELGKGSTFTLYLPFTAPFAIIDEADVDETETQITLSLMQKNQIDFENSDQPLSISKENQPQKGQPVPQFSNKENMFTGKKILIVDDDMRNSFALSKLLSTKGVIVKMARNGQKAIEMLTKEPDIDLVLMDIMMPVMDGCETIKRLRIQPKFRALPILALTAKAMNGDRERCLTVGANDYLSKPVDVDLLFSMLRLWLYQDMPLQKIKEHGA